MRPGKRYTARYTDGRVIKPIVPLRPPPAAPPAPSEPKQPAPPQAAEPDTPEPPSRLGKVLDRTWSVGTGTITIAIAGFALGVSLLSYRDQHQTDAAAVTAAQRQDAEQARKDAEQARKDAEQARKRCRAGDRCPAARRRAGDRLAPARS